MANQPRVEGAIGAASETGIAGVSVEYLAEDLAEEMRQRWLRQSRRLANANTRNRPHGLADCAWNYMANGMDWGGWEDSPEWAAEHLHGCITVGNLAYALGVSVERFADAVMKAAREDGGA